MVIGIGALLVAALYLSLIATQAATHRLTSVEESSSKWKLALWPIAAVIKSEQRVTKYVWDQMLAIMSRFAAASLHALAHWFWSLESLAADAAHSVASLAETVADAFEHALNVTVPHQIKAAVHAERNLRRIADEQLRRYARGIDRLVRDHVLPRVRAVERAVTVTIPRELGRIRAREKAIAARIPRGLSHRLTRLEKITAAAALAAGVVKVLARRFPWLFCRKTKRIGKALCGLDNDLIDGLLLGTIVVWSGFSIVEAVKDLQAIEGEAIKVMQTIIREL